MENSFLIILAVAGAAGLASPAGGLIAILVRPNSLFLSVAVGWLLLRDLAQAALGFLLATGAGGMFYLTVTDLVPEAQRHHYEGSGGLAAAAGFIASLVLAQAG